MKLATKFLPPIRHAWDLERIQMLRDAVNALRNATLIGGQVLTTDSNTVYIPGDAGGGGSYTGEWSATKQYAVQMIATRGVLGEFVCVAVPPVGTAPETGAPYWHAWQYPPPGVWQ